MQRLMPLFAEEPGESPEEQQAQADAIDAAFR